MKTIICALTLIIGSIGSSQLLAQGPSGNSFGFGIVLGEPLGGTVKFWTTPDQAFVASLGGSYFGNPRLGADYIWHFNTFNSNIVEMYAGPGLVIGFGEGREYFFYRRKGNDYFYVRERDETGFAMRAVVGLNITPRRTPMEIFFELGPLIGISPGFGAALDVAAGIRFYP